LAYHHPAAGKIMMLTHISHRLDCGADGSMEDSLPWTILLIAKAWHDGNIKNATLFLYF